MSNLLLDTCALLWLAQGRGELSRKTVLQIREASFVYVSSITAWEVGLLSSRGQVTLPSTAEEWFQHIIKDQDIQVINLTPAIAFLSNTLPWHHKDPADRFIIATAVSHDLVIVTADKKFVEYPVSIIN